MIRHISRTRGIIDCGLCGAGLYDPGLIAYALVGMIELPEGDRYCKTCISMWRSDKELSVMGYLRILSAPGFECIYVHHGCAHPIACRSIGACAGGLASV